MLLNSLQCTGQPPQQGGIQSAIPLAPRLRNAVRNYNLNSPTRFRHGDFRSPRRQHRPESFGLTYVAPVTALCCAWGMS